MPRVDVVVEAAIARSFKVEQVAGMFDLPADAGGSERFSVDIPAADECDAAGKPAWQIGLIVGPSGSGKTTVARAAFGAAIMQASSRPWSCDAAIVDGFGESSIRDITRMLTAVGFSSPPAWLRPYHMLSNGEKFRCDLARLLLHQQPAADTPAATSDVAVMDEFTSVVDRTVAKVCSAAVAKAIRGGLVGPRRFVAVACHYDILEWLCPDWVLDMSDGRLTRGVLRRPTVPLELRRCEPSLWAMFKRYHYLSHHLPAVMRCYAGVLAGQAAAFAAISPVIGYKGYRRFGRVVVLPDYQGIGIGGKFRDAVAHIEGTLPDCRRLSLVTSHPAMIRSCLASPYWRLDSARYSRGQRIAGRTAPAGHTRMVCSLVYRHPMSRGCCKGGVPPDVVKTNQT